jgi:aspergillopepsin I
MAPFNAILDTGTSLMVLDASLVDDYWSKVPSARYDSNQAGYVFPCSAELPDLELGLQTYIATIPGSFMNYGPVDSTSKLGIPIVLILYQG